MASWLGAWFAYYQRLYGMGLLVLFGGFCAALVSCLAVGIPLYFVAWLIGLEVSDTTVALVALAIAFPAWLGSFVRFLTADRSGYFAPHRPPSWSMFKLGFPLPARDE